MATTTIPPRSRIAGEEEQTTAVRIPVGVTAVSLSVPMTLAEMQNPNTDVEVQLELISGGVVIYKSFARLEGRAANTDSRAFPVIAIPPELLRSTEGMSARGRILARKAGTWGAEWTVT